MSETTRTRKPTPDLATDATGELFVKLNASGIAPLFVVTDGLPLIHFGRGKQLIFESRLR